MRIANFIALSAPLAFMAQALKAPIEGYNVWEPEWEIDGEHFNGSVQEVVRQLEAMRPEMVHALHLEANYSSVLANDPTDPLPLGDFDVQCQKLKEGSVSAWWDGINGRVSCSWNMGIWFCNDDTKQKILDTYRHIADGAEAAYRKCTGPPYFEYLASGQAFHKTDNWNVMVQAVDYRDDSQRC
ncbi:hypothetical protein CCHR01_07878 [Colletotrichum chrysophilum]|uniref:Uncharacterized protein n=1 Tax=Colletotrichum chrysophilum TaxID=1836956 RepID=A0AAD9AKQ9_9PEZI|nr:hypothetical protein CCHR01_07878 [Colletotrichum chrysophilum]